MTAKDTQALDVLLEMVKENNSANTNAHKDIVDRLNIVATNVTTTLSGFTQHCAEREKTVNAALDRLAPKKYTPTQSLKAVVKFTIFIIAQIGVVLGVLAALGVLT